MFTYDPDSLLPATPAKTTKSANSKKQAFSDRHELVVYVYVKRFSSLIVSSLLNLHGRTLMETNKPYILNVMRTPAMQTVFLYASTMETNNDFTRVLCDEWLEIIFDDSETAQAVISSVLLLRNARDLLLQLTLQGMW